MMKIKRNYKIVVFLGLFLFLMFSKTAFAAPETIDIPSISISVDGEQSNAGYVDNIKILIFLTILTLLPSFIIMLTCFTRIIVVFSLLNSFKL